MQEASRAAAMRLEAHLDCPLGHDHIISVWESERELGVHLTHIGHPLVKLLLNDGPLLQLPVQLLWKDSLASIWAFKEHWRGSGECTKSKSQVFCVHSTYKHT